jgi:hypothetical protein
MEKIKEWMEKNSHKLLAVFIAIQCVISAIFLFLFFLEEGQDNKSTLLFKVYSACLLGIFTIFMVHFAHHSVSYN